MGEGNKNGGRRTRRPYPPSHTSTLEGGGRRRSWMPWFGERKLPTQSLNFCSAPLPGEIPPKRSKESPSSVKKTVWDPLMVLIQVGSHLACGLARWQKWQNFIGFCLWLSELTTYQNNNSPSQRRKNSKNPATLKPWPGVKVKNFKINPPNKPTPDPYVGPILGGFATFTTHGRAGRMFYASGCLSMRAIGGGVWSVLVL